MLSPASSSCPSLRARPHVLLRSDRYQRIHVGNAVPFVLPLWLARWLQRNGYETKLVINITDINDKIYNAAPGASALAEDATRWYVEDTDA